MVWRELLTDYSLDPDDNSTDPTTAVGIGNAAGKGAQQARLYDGINQTGNYQDTTGYAPINTAFELRNPSRWQPGLRLQGIGIYTIQQFVTPQLANMEPMAPFDPREFRVGPPVESDPAGLGCLQSAGGRSAGNVGESRLTSVKLKSELFDNKIASLGLSYIQDC